MNGITKSAATTSVTTQNADSPCPVAPEQESKVLQEVQNDIFTAAQYGDWQQIEKLISKG